MSRRSTGLALATTLGVVLAGCASHVHNPIDEERAVLAQQRFDDLASAQRDAFGAMRSNLNAFAAQESATFLEVSERRTAALMRIAMRATVEDFVASYDEAVQDLEADLTRASRPLAMTPSEATDAAVRAAAGVSEADAALAAAKDRVTAWNRRTAVLETFLAASPQLASIESPSDFDTFADQAKGLAAQFGALPVDFVDADGAPVTDENGDPPVLKDLIGDVLDVDQTLMNGDGDLGGFMSGLRQLFDPDAPGLAVTTAALAKDLAAARQRVATDRLDRLQRQQNLADAAQQIRSRLELIRTNPTPLADAFEDLRVAAALDEASDSEDDLFALAEALQSYTVIIGPFASEAEQLAFQRAALDHEASITESEQNAMMREALIQRGLDGLVAYHRGGVKPEEVAELAFEAAKISLLGVIAADGD